MIDFRSTLSEYPLFLEGAYSTVLYSIGCLILGFLLGVLICMFRLSSNRFVSFFGRTYINMIRGTPLLILLLVVFNILPFAGLKLSPELSALLSLTICTAAYQAEILRGGFAGVPHGLTEAGRVTGLSEFQILCHIRLPLAVRLTLPALVNEATMMVKGTSLISVVGILELTRVAQNVGSSNFQPLESFIFAGVLYLAMTSVITGLGSRLERRIALESRS